MPDRYTESERAEMQRIKRLMDAKARPSATGHSVTLKTTDWNDVTDKLAQLVILGQRWSKSAKEKQDIIDAQRALLDTMAGEDGTIRTTIEALTRPVTGKMN